MTLIYINVFVTKYRRRRFTEEMLSRLNLLFKEPCKQMDCKLHEFNGEDDHVHLLVAYPPKLAISNLVRKLKGKSAYFSEKNIGTRLKTNYGVNTCGLPVIVLFPAVRLPWI
jgi:putative transposase